MENYFKGSRKSPYHLSVGAVVMNEKNEVAAHYFKKITLRKSMEGFTDFFILMRETIEMGERIEDTLHRGLMEEFGITGDIVRYLGSLEGEYLVRSVEPNYTITKTTLYFLVRMKTFDPSLRSGHDPEMESEIEWRPVDFLIPKMQEQGRRLQNGTLDESAILKRV